MPKVAPKHIQKPADPRAPKVNPPALTIVQNDGASAGEKLSPADKLLQSAVDRIERIEEEIRALNHDKSDVYQEMKGQGFDPKIIRWAISERRIDPMLRMERDHLRDLYARSLRLDAGAKSDAAE